MLEGELADQAFERDQMMTTQQVAECPKCGCDAMAETRSIKPGDLPALDNLDHVPPPVAIRRIFTCGNCGTKFKRVGDPEGRERIVRLSPDTPRTMCPKCGCTRMRESFQKEKYPEIPVYGIRYVKTPGDITWVHVCSKCGKRFEQVS